MVLSKLQKVNEMLQKLHPIRKLSKSCNVLRDFAFFVFPIAFFNTKYLNSPCGPLNSQCAMLMQLCKESRTMAIAYFGTALKYYYHHHTIEQGFITVSCLRGKVNILLLYHISRYGNAVMLPKLNSLLSTVNDIL